jgi:hypothetical protein
LLTRNIAPILLVDSSAIISPSVPSSQSYFFDSSVYLTLVYSNIEV